MSQDHQQTSYPQTSREVQRRDEFLEEVLGHPSLLLLYVAWAEPEAQVPLLVRVLAGASAHQEHAELQLQLRRRVLQRVCGQPKSVMVWKFSEFMMISDDI
jgi:hypothetical protein